MSYLTHFKWRRQILLHHKINETLNWLVFIYPPTKYVEIKSQITFVHFHIKGLPYILLTNKIDTYKTPKWLVYTYLYRTTKTFFLLNDIDKYLSTNKIDKDETLNFLVYTYLFQMTKTLSISNDIDK